MLNAKKTLNIDEAREFLNDNLNSTKYVDIYIDYLDGIRSEKKLDWADENELVESYNHFIGCLIDEDEINRDDREKYELTN